MTRPATITPASSPGTTRTSSPTRTTASTCTCSGGGLRVDRRRNDVEHRRSVLELRHLLQPRRRDSVRLPADDPPGPARRDDLRRPFWAGSDGGLWRRPLLARPREWTNLNATLHTTQNYSIAVGKAGRGSPTGAACRTTVSRTRALTSPGGAGVHRRRRRHHRRPEERRPGGRGVRGLDMYLTTDGAGRR